MVRAARRLRADRRTSRSARVGNGRGQLVRRCLHPRWRSGRADLAIAAIRQPADPAQSRHAAEPRRGQFLLARPLSRTRRGVARGAPGDARQFDRFGRRRGAVGAHARQARRASRQRRRGGATRESAARRPHRVRAHRDGGGRMAIGRDDESPCPRDRRGLARPAFGGHGAAARGAVPDASRHARSRGFASAPLCRDRRAVVRTYGPDRGVAVPSISVAGSSARWR